MIIGSFRNLPTTANTLVLPQMWPANESGYCLELTATKMMMCFFLTRNVKNEILNTNAHCSVKRMLICYKLSLMEILCMHIN